MKIFCVRIGTKYGEEYEDYIEDKLSDYDIHWIRQPFDNRVELQWNKMLPMNLDIDDPVCVMDIDVILMNDFKKIFDYPIQRGEFIGAPDWWQNRDDYHLNGGFFKYYPKDCKYIFDKFMKDPKYWQQHYIKNGTTIGPVNGEQYFVEDSVNEQLTLKLLPDAWFTRWINDGNSDWKMNINKLYMKKTGNHYLNIDEFHPDIKFIHYTFATNKPNHEIF